MKVDVKVPAVGESVTEGVVVEWHAQSGQLVAKDDPLFELETDKITMQVVAEASGRLSIAVDAGADVEIGQVVASIDTAAEATVVAESSPSAAPSAGLAAADEAKSHSDASVPLSPAVRRMVSEHRVDPAQLEGTGKGGRPTKGDVIALLERREAPRTASATQATPLPPVAVSTQAVGVAAQRETRKPMSSLRRRVAQRLVEAQQTAAMLTTFNEVDMSGVMRLRSRFKGVFAERHSVKLGLMSFFVKATVEALKSVPALNARIDGNDLVQNHYYDIGVAVGTERGLVVPVLRDANKLSFAAIEQRIADLAARASAGRLELNELQGGCFTISNGGVYGSMLSTPILNPPQCGILGMHGIKKRPLVVGDDDHIEVRPMMYLALSYDHRLVDGREAVTFLRRIVDGVETPERLMFEV